MDFFENFALPQSEHHMQLLKLLLIVTYSLLIPYLALLAGTSFYSTKFRKKAGNDSNSYLNSFAKDLIDIPTSRKSFLFAFGLIPILSIIFSYSQLLQTVNSNLPMLGMWLFVGTLVAGISAYVYKYSFHLHDLLKNNNKSEQDEIKYISAATSMTKKGGRYTVIFSVLSIYLVSVIIEVAKSSTLWHNEASFFNLFLSFGTIVNFVTILMLSNAFTSASIMFVYFNRTKRDLKYSEYLKNFGFRNMVISVLTIPALLFISLILENTDALNGTMIILIITAIFSILISASFSYFIKKDNSLKLSGYVYAFVLITIIAFIGKDQFAFGSASKTEFHKLAVNYETYQKDYKESLGLLVEEINGADIFNGRCIACHSFDKKIVGPPYNSVLPKYENNIEGLTKFILRPVKVNPDYTSMPNQGLKPNEAKAVAEYIYGIYEGK